MVRRLRPFVFLLLALAAVADAAPLRRAVPDGPVSLASTVAATGRIVVKFHEASGLRMLDGHVLAGAAKDGGRFRTALDEVAPGARLERRFTRPAAELDAERRAAETRSGARLADLNAYAQIDPGLPPDDLEGLRRIVKRLLADPAVETAFLEPATVPAALGFDAFTGTYTPPDLPTTPASVSPDKATPDYTALQGYLDSINGVHANAVTHITGSDGTDVKVVDIEGGWLWDHEDLPAPFHESGGQYVDMDWIWHGTAVLGEIVGVDNGIGVLGIAPACQAGAAAIVEQTLPDAISTATSVTAAGDVILIELHAPGPDSENGTGQYGYVPMEYWQDNFDAIQIATAAGRIVCEAAGNGQQDLDDPLYGDLFDPAYRHSGAILCGAANSLGAPEWFTNYGQRVDLHGWGSSVTTTGYGDLQGSPEPETAYYTQYFSGTSSASPIVVGSVVAVQGMTKANLSTVLDAGLMRDVLRDTGTPQQTSPKQIGPLPDIASAWVEVQAGVGVVSGTVTDGSTGLPVEGATVRVQGGSSVTITDATGAYGLGLPAGAVDLAFTSYFHEDGLIPAFVTAGATTVVDVVLTPLPVVTLAGTVVNDYGLPTTGARITPQDAPLPGAVAAVGGGWSLPGIPVGRSLGVLVDGVPFMGADYHEVTPFDPGGGTYPLNPELKLTSQSFSSTGGWTAYGAGWAWGTPSTGPVAGFSSGTCWGVGMNVDYDNNVASHVESPNFVFWEGDQLHLSLHYWCRTEDNWDGAQLRIWEDMGWTTLEPMHGYPSTSVAALGYEPGWTGDSGGWTGAVFDITPWLGRDVKLSVLFMSDEAVVDTGFFIDDVTFDTGDQVVSVEELAPPAAGVAVRAEPNPFNPTTSIVWSGATPGALSLRVFDARGRAVRTLFEGDTTAAAGVLRWDGRDDGGRPLPSGAYLVRVRNGAGETALSRVMLLK